MNITADTNVLLRAVVCGDMGQSSIAAAALMKASKIAVTLLCLCEFVWVLLGVCDFKPQDVAIAMRRNCKRNYLAAPD